jgi:hypothetical protein
MTDTSIPMVLWCGILGSPWIAGWLLRTSGWVRSRPDTFGMCRVLVWVVAVLGAATTDNTPSGVDAKLVVMVATSLLTALAHRGLAVPAAPTVTPAPVVQAVPMATRTTTVVESWPAYPPAAPAAPAPVLAPVAVQPVHATYGSQPWIETTAELVAARKELGR